MANAPSINAIPTEYEGTTFRSRLEARWAVFFDALEIPWQYEAEGYRLPNGTSYLPDFWLPTLDLFVEVKPDAGQGYEKANQLCWATGKDVCVTDGPPYTQTTWDVDPPYLERLSFDLIPDKTEEQIRAEYPGEDVELAVRYRGTVSWDNYQMFCRCPKCGKWGVQFEGRAERLDCPCPVSAKTRTGDIAITASRIALAHSFWQPGGKSKGWMPK